MAKKYYAVRQGRIPGIYETWEDCKKQVIGFSSAQYKSFPTLEEAESYLEPKKAAVPAEPTAYGSDTAVAYVDGSYRVDTKEFSCGAILFYQGEEFRFSEKFSDPSLADMRNVAGEIMGAVSVISHCLKNHIPKLVIYHDYEGVARWAEGDWKTNKQGTTKYAAFCRDAKKTLELSFVKVKGHSGDRYNELADELAKNALAIAK